jgi:hypothetical protein
MANVSPALTVSGPVSKTTLPRKPGRALAVTQVSYGAVKCSGPSGLFRVTLL